MINKHTNGSWYNIRDDRSIYIDIVIAFELGYLWYNRPQHDSERIEGHYSFLRCVHLPVLAAMKMMIKLDLK